MFDKLFLAHPRRVGESYWQHMRTAAGFAVMMLAGGVACFIHALLPSLFADTGSRTITALHDTMVVNRTRHQKRAAGK